MNRRNFIQFLGVGLATAFSETRLPFPRRAEAANPHLRLALLSDAHLKNGDPAHPEARLLARAVAEIRGLQPAPDLALFAGDLAHDADPMALALGREILADLPAPLLMVRGEGDGPADVSSAWRRLFGGARFTHGLPGMHIIGLDTALQPTAHGPAFALGEDQCRWLAAQLARLDPALPLIILSHAPLTAIFQPWRQWTFDAYRLAPFLAPFQQVLCLHGHVHHTGIRGPGSVVRLGAEDQGSGVRRGWPVARGQWSEASRSNIIEKLSSHTENRKPETGNLSLPATAWPLPSPLQGTPRRLTPGLPPHGCGWGLVQVQRRSWTYAPRLWEAA